MFIQYKVNCFLVICILNDTKLLLYTVSLNIIQIYRLEVLDNLEKEIKGRKEHGDSTEHHESSAEKKRPKVSTLTDTSRNEVNGKNWFNSRYTHNIP